MARVLVIGAGGREHALAWKLSQSEKVAKVTVAPGNAGTRLNSQNSKICLPPGDLPSISDHTLLSKWCKTNVELVVVGPEDPLANGLADSLSIAKVACFGPSKSAAQIEASKEWAKTLMLAYGIPTGEADSFADAAAAKEYVLKKFDKGCVVKCSGLAAGKGVVICRSMIEACTTIDSILVEKRFGAAGNRVIVEELLEGFEVSCLCFTDGKDVKFMPLAQDHKKLFDGEKGPNTGGMGAYAPCRLVDRETVEEIQHIMRKAVLAMQISGCPFMGILFGGFMVTDTGPKVLEFNCRFGDPETQVLLPLLHSDLYDIMLSCTNGTLESQEVVFDNTKSAVAVVAASAGYPEKYKKDFCITGIDKLQNNLHVFHAGTAYDSSEQVVTSGGRVLAVIAIDEDIETAARMALDGVSLIHFDGIYYRQDIAHSAFNSSLSYAKAGVNIEAGNKLVNSIKPACKKTEVPGCVGSLGMFGSVFDLQLTKFKDPLLVSGTDGVGTKLLVALQNNSYRTVGQDLVAMCVNDILCHGAQPLFFLDYFATGRLDVSVAEEVIVGIAEACKMAGCALVGGETAEMPDMYPAGKFDLAGFAVGAVERSSYLPCINKIKFGDVVIGLASSGLHSNGFSLVRRIIADSRYKYSDQCPFDGSLTIGETLLTPTKIYVDQVLKTLASGHVKAVSHITGGGLLENISRILPSDVKVQLTSSSWTSPPVFNWLQSLGKLSDEEMYHTFNCGLGMVLLADQSKSDAVCAATGGQVVGCVTTRLAGEGQVEINRHTTRVTRQIRVAVLISGTGTNLQALIDSSNSKDSKIRIDMVISNKGGVKGLERADAAGIPNKVISHEGFSTREAFDDQITAALEEAQVELICLAGFMRLLSGKFVERWRGQLLNIHPSLLPSFKGMRAQQQALDAGVKLTGCTVHFVQEEVDSGEILEQESVPVLPGDTVDSLSERIKAAEHCIFPKAVQSLAARLLLKERQLQII
ncbi:trifunctional purine biosynthetic protein adenosine-3-like [Watersipora subatra]|uniref:trifunctional purine biosynthetic protein adenosine-3-like n=1 Tax=Watersipora subatra TaxID=2589382 RepID=UPI00355C620C